MLDTHVAWLANQGMNYLATKRTRRVSATSIPTSCHIRCSRRGRAYGAVDRQRSDVQAFLREFRLEDCWPIPRFATNAARVENRKLVTDTLTPVMQLHTTQYWVERLEALKIGCGPINKLSQVFADPHVQARGVVVEMPHGEHGEGRVKVIANPVRLSETPADYRLGPPLLGQHTDAVLVERLGLDAAALAGAARQGRDLMSEPRAASGALSAGRRVPSMAYVEWGDPEAPSCCACMA